MSIKQSASLCKAGSFSLRIDGHCDTVTAMKNNMAQHIDFETIERYVDLQFFALYIKEEENIALAVAEAEEYYAYYLELLQTHEKLVPIVCRADLDKISLGKVGALLAIENAQPLAANDEALSQFIAKGYRSFGITWSNENALAGGVNCEEGLKPRGRKLLKNMNGEAVLVDLAHMNRKSFFQCLEVLEKAPIVTHSCCYGLCPHPRNLADDALKELADAGGFLGLTFVKYFLTEQGEATIDHLVDHIVYAAERLGIEGIGLGSDFDGTDLPIDMKNQSDIGKLYEKMAGRGFRPEEIEAIAGGNLQRILERTLI